MKVQAKSGAASCRTRGRAYLYSSIQVLDRQIYSAIDYAAPVDLNDKSECGDLNRTNRLRIHKGGIP